MPDQDTNREAVRQVEKITDSAPVNGEDLVESEDLKRKFREAKERLKRLGNAQARGRASLRGL